MSKIPEASRKEALYLYYNCWPDDLLKERQRNKYKNDKMFREAFLKKNREKYLKYKNERLKDKKNKRDFKKLTKKRNDTIKETK